MKIKDIKDEKNKIMQQISQSPNLLRFMEKTKEMKVASEDLNFSERRGLRDVEVLYDRYTPYNKWPPFLLQLISSENILALDYALSPSGLGYLYLSKYCSSMHLEDPPIFDNILIQDNDKRMMMSYIIQRALVLKDLWRGAKSVPDIDFKEGITKRHSHFAEPNTTLQVKRCIRLHWDLVIGHLQLEEGRGNEIVIKRDILSLDMVGEYNLFKAFIEEDETLLYGSQTLHLVNGKNLNEFVQKELRDKLCEQEHENLGLMDILVYGNVNHEHNHIESDMF